MKKLILSNRMKAVADMVPPHSCIVADVGCDHAYISICLVQEKKADRVIAMDLRKGPLQIAVNNIRAYGCEDNIEVRLSDGFNKLKAGEADTIIISGMGGLLITGILNEGIDILHCENPPVLILQPQSDIEEVRRFIYSIDYHIKDEKMLVEDGKFYTIISAYPGSGTSYDSKEEWIYGKCNIEKKDSVLIEYLQREACTLEKIVEKLEVSTDRNEEACEDDEQADLKKMTKSEKRMKEIEEKIRLNQITLLKCKEE